MSICHGDAMQAVREAVQIPVLANGNIRNLQDVHDCMAYTGAVGVMSAESLLEDPALFAERRLTPEGKALHSLCMATCPVLPGRPNHSSSCLCMYVHLFKTSCMKAAAAAEP